MKAYVTITLLSVIFPEDVDVEVREDCSKEEFYKIIDDYLKKDIDLIEVETPFSVHEVDIEVYNDEV